MSSHTVEHERMLKVLIEGDAGARSESLRAELAGCATCSEKLDELEGLTQALSRFGTDERELLAHARTLDHAPGSNRIAATLRSLVAEQRVVRNQRAPAPIARRPRIWPWVAAAGCIAALVLVLSHDHSATSVPDETTLGENHIELLTPVGEHASFDHFAWSGTLPPGAEFRVFVSDPSSPDHHGFAPQKVLGQSWNPPRSETNGWPDVIEWQVGVYQAGEFQWASQKRSASRRP